MDTATKRVLGVQLNTKRISRAIDDGLLVSDLFQIAEEDVITRSDVQMFFETALASYLLPDEER